MLKRFLAVIYAIVISLTGTFLMNRPGLDGEYVLLACFVTILLMLPAIVYVWLPIIPALEELLIELGIYDGL